MGSDLLGAEHDSYLASRFRPDPRRDAAWQLIVRYLSRWWSPDAAVVDVGAGYCSFINEVHAARRVAVDIHNQLDRHAAPGVECIRASATDLHELADESFEVVFASNLLEHLERKDIRLSLEEFRRVLRPGGKLLLVQPNYRLRPGEYFDDYTHITPLSDRSLADLLCVAHLQPVHVQPRFMPLTVKSRAARLSFLVPLYLRSPIRPRAGQMLVVAERPLHER